MLYVILNTLDSSFFHIMREFIAYVHVHCHGAGYPLRPQTFQKAATALFSAQGNGN